MSCLVFSSHLLQSTSFLVLQPRLLPCICDSVLPAICTDACDPSTSRRVFFCQPRRTNSTSSAVAASCNPFSPSVTYSPDIRLISSPSSLFSTLYRSSSRRPQRDSPETSLLRPDRLFFLFVCFFLPSLVNPSAVPDTSYVDFPQNHVAFSLPSDRQSNWLFDDTLSLRRIQFQSRRGLSH